MARTGGEKTRKRILAAAERLFSTRGFDAASVAQIARTAGVNKALIYYHFRNKNDLILSLFASIIEELEANVQGKTGLVAPHDSADLRREIGKEIEFLSDRKRILSLMLAEGLRSERRDHFLFRCAALVTERELNQRLGEKRGRAWSRSDLNRWVYEFFTGVIPLLAFITLRDKWCDYFKCDPDRLTKSFIEAFDRSHLVSHPAPRK